MKTLVAYSSRCGATEMYAKIIAEELWDDDHESDLVNLRKETPSPSKYDNVIVGSGIMADKIYKEVGRLLSQEELKKKKFFWFVSAMRVANPRDRKNVEANYLQAKPAEFGLTPVLAAAFGGNFKILWFSIKDARDPVGAHKWTEKIAKELKKSAVKKKTKKKPARKNKAAKSKKGSKKKTKKRKS